MSQDPQQQDTPQKNSNNKQTPKGTPNKNPTLQSPPKRKILLYRGQNSNINEDQSSPSHSSGLFDNVHLKEKLSSSDQREEPALSNNSRSSQRQENSNSRHAGSLDKFAEDPKRNSLNRERANLPPTFGEDQFNTAVLQQVLESPPPSKDKFTNVDRMLAEHKKKKAMQQKFIDLDLPDQHASPYLKKQKTPKSGSKVSFDLNRDFSLTTSDWTADSPLAIRPSNAKANISLQNQMRAVSEIYEKSQAYYEDSNPFTTDSYRNREEQIPENPKLPTAQNLSNFATSPQSGQSKGGSPKNAKNVPKISGNSKRIFKNSQRAKEDAQILENLINANMVKQKRLSQASFEGLRNIPEESDETSTLQSRKISTPQKGFSTPQRNTHNKNVDPRINSLTTSPQGPSLRTTQGNFATPEKQLSSIQRQKGYDSSKFMSPNDSRSTINPVIQQQRSSSPKTPSSPNRSIRRNIQDSLVNTTSISIVYPQKSAPSATIVEHKKKTPLEAIKSSKKKSVSPSREELKEWANMAKSIYLRVVNNEPNVLEPSDVSPKSFKAQVKKVVKAHPAMEASEFVKKLAEKAKSIDPRKLSPEELKDYDEIQRLEIMLRNLRMIQKADLINAEKNNSTTFGDRSNWEQYAVEINDDATERRSIRKQKTNESLARLAKSMSPGPMPKLEISVESLFGSALLRQNLVPPPREEGSNSQRSYLNRDVDIYERNIMWLNAKHEKLDKLGGDLAEEEVRECSFKPIFFTKSPSLYSPIRNTGNSPISNINTFTDRGTEENENQPMEKSLYREKKALETYLDLNDLKKTYNLYKSEIFLPMRIHTSTTSTPVPKMERSHSNQHHGGQNLIRPIHTDA